MRGLDRCVTAAGRDVEHPVRRAALRRVGADAPGLPDEFRDSVEVARRPRCPRLLLHRRDIGHDATVSRSSQPLQRPPYTARTAAPDDPHHVSRAASHSLPGSAGRTRRALARVLHCATDESQVDLWAGPPARSSWVGAGDDELERRVWDLAALLAALPALRCASRCRAPPHRDRLGGELVGKRHRRIRARSATRQVAGRPQKSPGSKPIAQNGLPNLRSPRSPLSQSAEATSTTG